MNNMDDRPIPASYWVIPGKFLAGEYPGKSDPTSIHRIMTSFLNAGFDTFINLTDENEKQGYAGILSEEAGYYQRKVSHNIFAITDFGLPSKSQMSAILDCIDQALAGGHKLYLHCWAGIGRTGTTVGCYLVRHGMSGEQALGKLAEMYATSSQSRLYSHSPENPTQFNFIRNWHEE